MFFLCEYKDRKKFVLIGPGGGKTLISTSIGRGSGSRWIVVIGFGEKERGNWLESEKYLLIRILAREQLSFSFSFFSSSFLGVLSFCLQQIGVFLLLSGR